MRLGKKRDRKEERDGKRGRKKRTEVKRAKGKPQTYFKLYIKTPKKRISYDL